MGVGPALARLCALLCVASAAGWHGGGGRLAVSARRGMPPRASPACKQAGGQAGKQVADNRIARMRYEIVERVECGIALLGTEVKSCRSGNINLRDGYAAIADDGIWLHNVHVGRHATTGRFFQHEETRSRRLLLKHGEIRRLRKGVDTKGYTLVPLRAFFNEGNLLKVEIGLARGLKAYDKSDQLKERDLNRDLKREVKDFINR